MDMTCIPMRRGFVCLTAVLDWATRRVLAWHLSNTLTADRYVEALEEAIQRFGTPDIMNTDQGSQFTTTACIRFLSRTPYRSAWMARIAGATRSLSSASGNR